MFHTTAAISSSNTQINTTMTTQTRLLILSRNVTEINRLLTNKLLDPNGVLDESGNPPLFVATKAYCVTCAENCKHCPTVDNMIDCFIQAGANTQHINKKGQSLIHFVLEANLSKRALERLITLKVLNVNERDDQGRTPLMQLMDNLWSREAVSRAMLLLALGADALLEDNKKGSLLTRLKEFLRYHQELGRPEQFEIAHFIDHVAQLQQTTTHTDIVDSELKAYNETASELKNFAWNLTIPGHLITATANSSVTLFLYKGLRPLAIKKIDFRPIDNEHITPRECVANEQAVLRKVTAAKKENQPGAQYFVTYYGHYQTENPTVRALDPVCLVFEFVPGTLDSWMMAQTMRKVPDFSQIYHYTQQLGEAVSWLHHNKVIWVDVKPGNVLLQDNRVRLIDFGYAFCIDSEEKHEKEKFYFRGTPLYCSPEVFVEEKNAIFSFAHDMYGLGIIVGEMASGESYCQKTRFYTHDSFREEVQHGLRPRLHPDSPPKIAALVHCLWAADRHKRLTAAELVQETTTDIETISPGLVARKARTSAN